MNVYVNSNFVIELALRQEQYAAASRILSWAQQKRLTLVCPALVLAEPLSNMNYRRVERKALGKSLRTFSASCLARSGEHLAAEEQVGGVLDYLDAMDKSEAEETHGICRVLLATARIMPLNVETMDGSRIVAQDYDIGLTDSLVLTAILVDLLRLESRADRRRVFS